MENKIPRSKQQILFGLLPGRTFDFEKGKLAKIKTIRGKEKNSEININLVLKAVAEYVKPWSDKNRPGFRTEDLSRGSRNNFVLIEPKSVESELFPLIFWCRNCHRIFDYTNRDLPNSAVCPKCHTSKLIQLRWVKIHRCGELEPWKPFCMNCKTSNDFSLDTKNSERVSNFVCTCNKCGSKFSVFAGNCRSCTWTDPIDGDMDPRKMAVEVHRSSRTYYPHYVVLLNKPGKDMDSFLSLPDWYTYTAASYLKIPEICDKKLLDFAAHNTGKASSNDITIENLKTMLKSATTPEQRSSIEAVLELMKSKNSDKGSKNDLSHTLEKTSGITNDRWENISQELLESVLPFESNDFVDIGDEKPIVKELGIKNAMLVTDFPMLMASFGYSRVDYKPNNCRINPFPREEEYGGKYPIYVDMVQADAILFRLDYNRVLKWLELNGYKPNLPIGSDKEASKKAYFVEMLHDVPSFRMELHDDNPEARLVFGLIHTMSHLCIRKAALLCGLDRTSLSEYILPRTLTFAIYSNHRSGATIGALSSLFEQSIDEWLTQVQDSRHCVYDPVCAIKGGDCHACTHLAETSCRFFNLNLSRAFLFGGEDKELGRIVGYFNAEMRE